MGMANREVARGTPIGTGWGTPIGIGWGYPHGDWLGVSPTSGLDSGYPLPAHQETEQLSKLLLYGGMRLAFTQEDFLVCWFCPAYHRDYFNRTNWSFDWSFVHRLRYLYPQFLAEWTCKDSGTLIRVTNQKNPLNLINEINAFIRNSTADVLRVSYRIRK